LDVPDLGLQAEELLRRNGEYQAMVTDLQRRLNDARAAADEAADKSRRESQRCQVCILPTASGTWPGVM
jgi:hypothetical protein